MNDALKTATADEKSMATALIGVAAAVFAGVMAFLPTMLSMLSDTGDTIAAVVTIVVLILLGLSILFGGRGYAKGPGKSGIGDRFNLQATLGGAAIVLIAASSLIMLIFAERTDLDSIKARLAQLETDATKLREDVAAINPAVSALSTDLTTLREDFQRRQSDIENQLRGLSERVALLEAAAVAPSPPDAPAPQ